MGEIWPRLEAVFASCCPEFFSVLRPPATETQIGAFEEATGMKLPEDVRGAYLWHDGCVATHVASGLGSTEWHLLPSHRWCSLDEVLARWRFDRELDETYESEPYSYTEEEDPSSWGENALRPWQQPPPSWLAIGQVEWMQSSLYLDLAPGPKGHVGQLIDYRAAMTPKLVAPSLHQYLEILALCLEQKAVAYNSAKGSWVTVSTGQPWPSAQLLLK